MAEFCLDCWNEINGTNDTAEKYIFTKNLELCEGCGKLKNTIIIEKKYRIIKIPYKIFNKKIK